MNSQKLSRLILGVFTTAVASSLLLACSIDHGQMKGASVHPQVADGSGPIPPPVQPQIVSMSSTPATFPTRRIECRSSVTCWV